MDRETVQRATSTAAPVPGPRRSGRQAGLLCSASHASAFLVCVLGDAKRYPMTCPATTGTGLKRSRSRLVLITNCKGLRATMGFRPLLSRRFHRESSWIATLGPSWARIGHACPPGLPRGVCCAHAVAVIRRPWRRRDLLHQHHPGGRGYSAVAANGWQRRYHHATMRSRCTPAPAPPRVSP